MIKKIVNLVFVIIILLGILFALTGCEGKEEKTSKQEEKTNNDNSQSAQVVDIDGIADFDGDIAVVSKTINYKSVKYVIDKNFQVLSSYEGNEQYKDGYIMMQDENNKEVVNIKDIYGNIVFSYNKATDYNDVKLVGNGCIITEKQTDTYNTSLTVTGIYDLKEQKYVLEPDEKYNKNIREQGEDMLELRDGMGDFGNSNRFFNLKTKKIVEYSEGISNDFKDGYAVDNDVKNSQYYIKIFDTEGNMKTLNSLLGTVNKKANSNGMILDTDTRIERIDGNEQITGTYVQLFDFEKETVKELSDQFISIANQPLFTKDGYALIKFRNQGGRPYYTVIDREGNKLFEPQKISNEASYGAQDNGEKRRLISENLEEGNYFIVTDDGVYNIIDKNNKIIVTASENEIFEGITNNVIKVRLKTKGYADTFYYKDLKGNKVSIIKK